MAKVFVTGISGFLGHHLASRLVQQGDRVLGLVRSHSRTDRLAKMGIELVEGDITRPETYAAKLSGVEVVYHLAGLTRAIDRDDFFRVNVGGAESLASACSRCDLPPTMIYVSSLAAAGPSRTQVARREEDRPAPVSQYGKSKLAGEQVLLDFADRVPISIIRPPIIFGEGDAAFFELVKPIFRTRFHFVPGYRRKWYSIVHAEDVVSLLSLVARTGQRLDRHRPTQGIYFVEAEKRLSYGEIGRLIATCGGVRAIPIPIPHAMVWTMATTSEWIAKIRGNPPVLNRDKAREVTAGSWICDAARARQLGFCPAQPLDARMLQTITWYCKERWL